MKINIQSLKQVPNFLKKDNTLELCYFGAVTNEIKSWIDFHQLESYVAGNFTNIKIPDSKDINSMFIAPEQYTYLDGFSPNLNKSLHIGHFSNYVLAKAFYKLGIGKNTLSIYGDLLEGDVEKSTAYSALQDMYDEFEFGPNKEYFASEMVECKTELFDGEDQYAGSKYFQVGDNKIVGLKNDGSTTYFYQDVCLAEKLIELSQTSNEKLSMLYMTGEEQKNHFELLKVLFPHVNHIPLGLIKASGIKMGTRNGNVIYVTDFIKIMKDTLPNNDDIEKLIYNVFAGYILKSAPKSDKNINIDTLEDNPKNSPGLYLGYTTARLNSAGVKMEPAKEFTMAKLEYAYLKSKATLNPSILFEAIIEVCADINSLYITHHIKDNDENNKMFEVLISNVLLGAHRLGLFTIYKF